MGRSAPSLARIGGEAPDRTWTAPVALLFAAAFGTNVSTPLLVIYRTRLDVSTTVVTAVFGMYALGLAPSLLLGGPASDRYGRSRLLLPGAVLAAVASVLFVFGANSIPMLFVARFVQGLATGVVFSVGSAWLQELLGSFAVSVAARHGSLALNVGFCLGPLTSGLLGQYGPWPLVLPYLVHAGLMLAALGVAVWIARHGSWTAGRRGVPSASLLPRARLGHDARRLFRRRLIPTAVCVYAFPSVAVTVVPLSLPRHSAAVAFAGVTAAVALGAGTLVQPFAHLLASRAAEVGIATGAAGYAVGLAAVHVGSMPLTLTAGLLLGAGGGLCLNAGLVLVQRLSTPLTRGACNGLFYAWAYLGFAAPLLATAFVAPGDERRPLIVLTALAAATAIWVGLTARSSATAASR